MIAGQFDIVVGLLKEIRDRLPRPVPVANLTTSDEAATQVMRSIKPEVVPYTIKAPISRTEAVTRYAYVDTNEQIRYIDPAAAYAPAGWRALWIEVR